MPFILSLLRVAVLIRRQIKTAHPLQAMRRPVLRPLYGDDYIVMCVDWFAY